MPNVLRRYLNMKQIIKCSLVAISTLFVAIGCGGSGDSGDGDENSTSQSAPTGSADTELVYLKVDGMS